MDIFILFFLAPRLWAYLWNYWTYRDGSPIKIYGFKQGNQLHRSKKFKPMFKFGKQAGTSYFTKNNNFLYCDFMTLNPQ